MNRAGFVPRCACAAAIGWTRLIRRQPCLPCALAREYEKRGMRQPALPSLPGSEYR